MSSLHATLVEHLTTLFVAVSSGHFEGTIDTKLIDTFALRAKFEPGLIFNQVGLSQQNGRSSCDKQALEGLHPEILRIIGLLFFIINSPNYYLLNDNENLLIELLASLLKKLTLTQTIEIFNNCDPEGNYNFNTIFKLCLCENANPKIQQLAVDILASASVVELRRLHETLVAEIFEIFGLAKTDTNVINAIDKFFSHVLSLVKQDTSLFYKVFTDDNVRLLFAMKNSRDGIVVVRLLDFNISLFEQVPELVITDKAIFNNLYLFDEKSFLDNDDMFYLNKLINLHSVIFKIDLSELREAKNDGVDIIDEDQLISKFNSQIQYLFKLFATVDQYSINSLIEFFASLSYFSPKVFIQYDKEYHVVNTKVFSKKMPPRLEENTPGWLLLSNVNPQVIDTIVSNDKANLDLKSLPLTNAAVAVYKNFISDEALFHVIKEKLTISAINNLTPTNVLQLLIEVSKHFYSTIFLLNEIPIIFNNNLLGSDAAKNLEEIALRKNYNLNLLKIDILSNLISVLSQRSEYEQLVAKLKVERSKLTSGDIYNSSEVQTAIESSYS